MKDSIGWTNGIRFVKTDHSKDFRIIFLGYAFQSAKNLAPFRRLRSLPARAT